MKDENNNNELIMLLFQLVVVVIVAAVVADKEYATLSLSVFFFHDRNYNHEHASQNNDPNVISSVISSNIEELYPLPRQNLTKVEVEFQLLSPQNCFSNNCLWLSLWGGRKQFMVFMHEKCVEPFSFQWFAKLINDSNNG
uniref:Uncharacterized protein n=1 Tax=Glossina austeni TaxID=7395 RepID=A0A1A9VPU0_GLOAU